MNKIESQESDSISTVSNSTNMTNISTPTSTTITLKSIQNTVTEISIDINDMIKDSLSQILLKLEANSLTHDIKLIFRGKILSPDSTFASHGIGQGHVLLYMLKEKESTNNLNSEASRNVSLLVENTEESIRNSSIVNQPGNLEGNVDLRTLVSTQGFSRFRNYGMSAEEVHMLRVMFHTNFMVNNRNIPQTAWTPPEIIRREEDWIQQVQNEDSEVPSRAFNTFGAGTRVMNLLRRNNGNSVMDVQSLELDNESNFKIVLGFILGIFLNYLVIFFVFFFRLRPKFKLGLLIGGLVGTILSIIGSSGRTTHNGYLLI